MRLLLDSCVWGKACERLRAAGHDVVWVGDSPEDPGDEELLAQANTEQRILVTLDKDFGEMAIVHGAAHCGILRLVNIAARRQARLCLHALEKHGPELFSGAIVTAEAHRLRIRPPERPD